MLQPRFPRFFQGIAFAFVFFLCPLVSFGQVDPPAEMRQQEWKDIASYPGKGLTPLYVQAGNACLEILDGTQQWAVLPRPINSVKLKLDAKPCFIMHNGDSYYDDRYGNDKASRWAAEQNWGGKFKLFLNSRCAALEGDEIVLSDMSFFNGDSWRRYKPLEGKFAWEYAGSPTLARAAEGSWWWASPAGLFRIEKGSLRRMKIDGWEDVSPQGIVSDQSGQAVVWSSAIPGNGIEAHDKNSRNSKVPHYAKVAFFDQKEWHSIQVPRVGSWTSARIRKDGSFVLAGVNHHIIVPPLNAGNLNEVESQLDTDSLDLSESDRKQIGLGHIKVNDVWCKRSNGAVLRLSAGSWETKFGMTLDGGILLSAQQDTGEARRGLVRIDESNKATWINRPQEKVRESKFALHRRRQRQKEDARTSQRDDYPDPGLQIAAQRDGSFVVLDPERGLYSLGSNSNTLSKLTETALDDVLLGCDGDGRVYIRRSEAVLVFLPTADAIGTTNVQEHFELVSGMPNRENVFREDNSTGTPLAAAIDSKGNLIAIGAENVRRQRNGFGWSEKGARLKGMPKGKTRFDRSLRFAFALNDAISVWPGRDGWSLVLCADQRAALIAPDKQEVIVEQSLLELAVNAHEQMLAAAPLQSMDRRYNLLSRGDRRDPQGHPFGASPWLAIGNAIWISTPKHVYRVEKDSPAGEEIEAEEVEAKAKPKKDAGKTPAFNFDDVVVRRVGVQGADMLGPLSSGELVLMPYTSQGRSFRPNRRLKPESLVVVEKPNENGDAVLIGSVREKTKPSDNLRPVSGRWFLDSKGKLWMDEGFDRVYQIESARKWPQMAEVGDVHFQDPSGASWGYHSERVFPGYERIDNGEKSSVRQTYLNHLRPLAAEDGHVICLTPLGLAKIKFDPDAPESQEIVATMDVRWLSAVKHCLGISHGQLWFVMRHASKEDVFNVLASVSLENWKLKVDPREDPAPQP